MADNINPENAILTNLVFGISNIKAQMEAIEAMANKTALTVQEAFAKTQLNAGTGATDTVAKAGKVTALQQSKIEAVRKESEAKQTAMLAESAAKQDAIVNASTNAQVLAREKADAAIITSAAKTQAEVEAIQARASISTAKAGVYDARSSAISAESTAAIEAQNAKTLATVEKTEAQKGVIVAKGEAEVSSIRAKETLTQQKIIKESSAVQLATVKKQVEQEKLLYMQSRRAAFEQKPQGMAGLMERRLSWLGTGALVMGGLAGVGEIASTIKDVEFGMTTIARVTEDVNFNFKGMRDELQQLGVTYGDVWADVSDIAIRWAQAGYDQAETLELTKDSLLALNTAELNSEQAWAA